MRGRKSVVVMSPGFILDQELALFRQVEDAARRANIAMYFVDVRGLEAQSVFGSAQFGSPIDSRDVGAANADPTLEAEGAVSLAETSGGFAVQNRNDLAAGLRRIARESQVYYLLGYVPSDARADGKFRRISVRVDRPDVQVRARKGYYAGGVPSEPGTALPTMARDALEVALDSPYDLGALPVRAASYVFGDTKAGDTSVLLAVEADLRSFDLQIVRRDRDRRARPAGTRHESRDGRDEALRAHGGDEAAGRRAEGRNVGLVSALGGLRARARQPIRRGSRCAIGTAAASEP